MCFSVVNPESFCNSKPIGKSDYVLEQSCEVSSSYLTLHWFVVIGMETGGFYLGVPRYRLHWVGIK